MAGPLEGRVAAVTGASSGIGEATVRALSAAGASVALGARRTDRLEALAGSLDGETLVRTLDVSDEEQARDFVQAAHDELEGVVARTVEQYTPGEVFEDWDLGGLQTQLRSLWPLGVDMGELDAARAGDREGLVHALTEDALSAYERREGEFGAGAPSE